MPIIRVGVIGLGQGRAHTRAFQTIDDSRVVAICDRDRQLAERAARELEVPRAYGDLDAILADREVDLVVIATPDHLHGRHAIAALEAGKHVLSEIPMALTVEECRRILTLTHASGLKYQMGNQVRYAHCLQDAKRLAGEGVFGEIFYGEGEYLHTMKDVMRRHGDDHWRVDLKKPQTTLLGGGPHAIDTLRWLMGVRFVSAQAFHAEQVTRWGTIHTTAALFKADTGAVAKVTVSYGMARPYCLYYSVYGTEGSFERTRDQGPMAEETTNLYAHERLSGSDRMIPVCLANFSNPRLARRGVAMGAGHGTMEYEQAADLLDAIIHDREPSLGPAEAATSIVPAIYALESASQGGGLVEIPSLDG
ncbi:MAG: Gfo/Idh/MocA family protein [Thermomicrobiales bacterium]